MRSVALVMLAVPCFLLCVPRLLGQPTHPQSQDQAAKTTAQATVLDSVIAVVNHQVILSSDLDLELRMMRLLPAQDRTSTDVSEALDQLTTRALIEQQIVLEDPHGLDVDPSRLQASLQDLRKNLPACRRHDCASSAGWSTYLATLGLTPQQVERYWSHRMAVLAFIERRFRSGIRIAPEEIEKYYRQTLLPQYPSPASAPQLDQVSARIQDLLLEQQVNSLLDDWLKNLQAQGEVEILDPALAASAEKRSAEKASSEVDATEQKGEAP
ncbi:MAG TPA: hypothetical protein VL346_06735 [Acidobacteriaceae bacterium]|nr:hypothetical protein [Acidobacteriaceae bacterium]